MADDLPYMLTVKNLDKIFDKIKTAGTPPKFTNEFLKASLGFASSQDRGVTKVLKQLGFLTPDAVPTPRYNEFRQSGTSGKALAAGLREGWAAIFLADQEAYSRTTSQLKEIFKSTTGKAEAVSEKMASTFKTIAQKSDFTGGSPPPPPPPPKDKNDTHEDGDEHGSGSGKGKRVALHTDVHIHLPPSSDVAVYTAIFRALREELLD
jgi:hypothetical protein